MAEKQRPADGQLEESWKIRMCEEEKEETNPLKYPSQDGNQPFGIDVFP